jgi:hypothetical protein
MNCMPCAVFLCGLTRSQDLFETASLHETQLSFTNFTMWQLNLRVGCSVWLGDRLQLQENGILVGIVHYALETMFSHTTILFSIIFLSKK